MSRPLVGARVVVTSTGAVGRVIDVAPLQREVLVEFGGLGQHWYREAAVRLAEMVVDYDDSIEPRGDQLVAPRVTMHERDHEGAHLDAIEARIAERAASATFDTVRSIKKLDPARIAGTGVIFRPGRVEFVPKGGAS